MRGNVGTYDPDSQVGWVALARSSRFHKRVGMGKPVKPADAKRGAYSKFEAWVDLIMMACHSSAEWLNKGREVGLESGQLAGGYSFLADRWNWTLKTVRTFLAGLAGEGMIERSEPSQIKSEGRPKQGKQKSNLVQTISICNYKIYQVAHEIDGLMKGQAKGKRGASEGHDSKEQVNKISPNGDSSPKQGDLLPPAEPVASEKPKQIEAIEAARIVARAWNEMAGRCGLAKIEKLTTTRGAAICRRILDAGSLEKFLEVMARIERTPWMLGENDRGWRADFDFILQPSSFTKLMEGAYERGKRSGTNYSANGAYMGALL